MKKKIKKIVKFILSNLFSEKILDVIVRLEPKLLLRKGNFFWSIKKITKSTKLNNKEIKYERKIKFGIVVQGPIIKELNFTIDNLISLRENYPEAKIVLSTWENEDINQELLKKLKIEVIKNKYPEKGLENLNYQIFSTIQGIKKLKECGVEYILKLRTDQRIYNKNIEISLVNLLDIFPIKGENLLQKKRIITTGINTYKYLPFSISDMLMFGTIEDMEKYWEVELSKKELLDNEIFKEIYKTTKKKTIWSCEIYLYVNFLKKVKNIKKINYSLNEYYKTLHENVIITDIIEFYWFKYRLLDDNLSNNRVARLQFLREDEWINLYQNYNKINITEIEKMEKQIFKEG